MLAGWLAGKQAGKLVGRHASRHDTIRSQAWLALGQAVKGNP